MVEIKLVRSLNEIAPDIAAVVNAPENPIQTRAYIFREDLDPVFGNIQSASDYLIGRLKKIPKLDELYIIAFLFAKYWEGDQPIKDKDIFVFPFEQSSNPRLTRANPYLIKNWVHQCWTPRFKEDFGIILADEAIHRRQLSPNFEAYINTFPKLSFNEYI
jgi:hypothetical protein